jgi:hypothetical protein
MFYQQKEVRVHLYNVIFLNFTVRVFLHVCQIHIQRTTNKQTNKQTNKEVRVAIF